MVRQLRRRAGMPKSSRQASDAPPAAYQVTPGSLGWARAALEAAVVFTVSVDVCALVSLIAIEAGERLHVAGSLAAVGVIAQVRLTVPVKPLTGVTETVVVPLYPAITVIAAGVAAMEKSGGKLITYHALATLLMMPLAAANA
jgi:uncharacterized Tic20 family protein